MNEDPIPSSFREQHEAEESDQKADNGEGTAKICEERE